MAFLLCQNKQEYNNVEDIDIVSDTFIRQDLGDKEVKVYYSYNPPKSYACDGILDDDYLIHHSTYLDDEKGFLSSQMLRKIEKV